MIQRMAPFYHQDRLRPLQLNDAAALDEVETRRHHRLSPTQFAQLNGHLAGPEQVRTERRAIWKNDEPASFPGCGDAAQVDTGFDEPAPRELHDMGGSPSSFSSREVVSGRMLAAIMSQCP